MIMMVNSKLHLVREILIEAYMRIEFVAFVRLDTAATWGSV